MEDTGSISSEKVQLRRRMLNQLENLDLAERNRRSLTICEQLLNKFSDAQSVALFAPTFLEPNLDLLWEMQGATGKHFFYPRSEKDGLRFIKIGSLAELQPGRWGIREPLFESYSGVPDLVVVPGCAFTRDGLRLGRGGGYYDRFLAMLPQEKIKIGVCYEFQIVRSVPCESHDITMDEVVCG